MYDHLLGGKDNFAADREAAARLVALVPDAQKIARDNREFLVRSVRFLPRPASGSSSTSAPASRPRRTCTR
jgi:hypothetical protein